MGSNRNVEAHRRARKARKRAERKAGTKRVQKVRKCSHAGFSTRVAAVGYGFKRYGRLCIAARCPACGKFVID